MFNSHDSGLRALSFWRFALFSSAMLACGGARSAEPGLWRHPDPRLAAVDDAVDADDFPKAQKLLGEVRADARRAKDAALNTEALERGKEVTKLARDFEKVGKSLKVLEKSPNDAKASLVVGRYHCVMKGDWKRGLPLLAAGDDPRLASIALDETVDIVNPDAQYEMADRWWQYAEKVNDAAERIAYQVHARDWMIRARAGVSEKQRAAIDLRLKQVPLFAEKIVVWNTCNNGRNDRGAEEVLVLLSFQGEVVWKQLVEIPWVPNEQSYVLLRPKRVRADLVRVEITRRHDQGGGLAEVEVLVGRKNCALGCRALADAYFEFNKAFVPSNINDGDTSNKLGAFWVTDNGKDGWVEIHLADIP